MLSNEDIEVWIRKNGGGDDGIRRLDEAYRQGTFNVADQRDIGVYLQNVRERAAAERRAHDQGLALRAVDAAESQAKTAKEALERSNIAIVISIVAILLAILDLATRH